MKKTITAFMAAAMTLAACTKDFHENAPLQQDNLMSKLVGAPAGEIIPGSL